jgi:hypothetical protein
LDALGVPHGLGVSVPLEFTVGGVQYTETFTLCGYWTGDPVMAAQQIWLSKDYVESVGMTGSQLRQTLFFEGSGHAVSSLVFTLTAGAGIGLMITRVVAGQVWFFKQNFTILPSLVCAIPLLVICAAAPLICHRRLTRESLVERLRVE